MWCSKLCILYVIIDNATDKQTTAGLQLHTEPEGTRHLRKQKNYKNTSSPDKICNTPRFQKKILREKLPSRSHKLKRPSPGTEQSNTYNHNQEKRKQKHQLTHLWKCETKTTQQKGQKFNNPAPYTTLHKPRKT
jgi:hypothetical protein